MSNYTLEEVSQHNSPTDLWIVIRGKVYDITDFVQEHPGGVIPLAGEAGGDATDAFESIGHTSQEAKQLMEKYYIGDLCKED